MSEQRVPSRPRTAGGAARSTIARTSIYVSTLPVGCRTVIIEGVSLHSCGGTYYQPYGGRWVVVNVG